MQLHCADTWMHAPRGRRTKDGKSYVQLVIPRRRTPHPCSLGGVLHSCFFAAKDPFDTDECVAQVWRRCLAWGVSLIVRRTFLLCAVSSLTSNTCLSPKSPCVCPGHLPCTLYLPHSPFHTHTHTHTPVPQHVCLVPASHPRTCACRPHTDSKINHGPLALRVGG